MRNLLKSFNEKEQDNPNNKEMALVWTILDNLSRCNQLAHEPDIYRMKDFKYGLGIVKKLIDGYLESN